MTSFWDIQQREKSLRLKIIIYKSQENEDKEEIGEKILSREWGKSEEPLNLGIERIQPLKGCDFPKPP